MSCPQIYRRSLPVLFAFLVVAELATAQEFDFRREINPFPVQESLFNVYPFPFLGGFNAPRPQFVDIDGDGDPDLFIQEQSGGLFRPGQLMFFENVGSLNDFAFQWRSDWFENLDVGRWFRFVDIDSDGDFDLFCESSLSYMRYFRNDGTRQSAHFVAAVDTLRDVDGSPITVDINSIPDFADIDCDGDPDLFLGRQTGYITFYENVQTSADGVPLCQFVTDKFEDIFIFSGGLQIAAKPSQENLHGANSLTFLDIDADLDPDLFWGDFFERSIVFLENTGNCQNPEIAITTREFPSDRPLMSGGFNVPRFADMDGDGDYDMFVGILGGAFSPIQNLSDNFYFYRNTGSGAQPDFVLQSRRFISTLDIGANSIPEFVDFDHDGDFDLFLTNEADPAEEASSHIYFFENQGTATAPKFILADDDFLNLNIGFNYAPTFVDIDADGDPDLFVGEWDGRLNFVENVGSPNAPAFGPVKESYRGIAAGRDTVIDVGNNSAPTFADIDADGDLDMFIGEFTGNINFYRNTGFATSAQFEFETANYFNIDVGEYSFPIFVDLDKDGDQDLLVGSDQNGVVFYRNTGSQQQPNFVQDAGFALTLHNRTTQKLIDVDGDGDLDFFAGGARGGMVYYENREIVTTVRAQEQESSPNSFQLLQNYPNPFNASTTLRWNQPNAGAVQISVFNVLGQEIARFRVRDASAGKQSFKVDLNDQPTGVYFYQIRANGISSELKKMILLK